MFFVHLYVQHALKSPRTLPAFFPEAGLTRGIRNPGVRQCLVFCTADFWFSLAYESAEQKTKHYLAPGFLIPLGLTHVVPVAVDVVLALHPPLELGQVLLPRLVVLVVLVFDVRLRICVSQNL